MRRNSLPTITWILAFLSVTLNLGIAFASLYPTQPTEATEFSAGQLALITWKDDKHRPHLEDMGHLWIKLFDANEKYVATLAKHVSPTAYSQSVFIPTGLRKSSHYFLSLSCKDPNFTVYSADFSITPSSYLFPADIKLGNKTASSYSNRTSFAPSPTAASDKDRTSTKNVTTSSPASESPTATAPRTDHTQAGNNAPHTDTGGNLRKGAGMKIDLELHQFMVVVLWHAMIGIFMAI